MKTVSTRSAFRTLVLRHYVQHGRHNLPWRKTRDPYRILISEVMLQQTPVSRVLQKYPEFLKAFPNFHTLANAPLPKILAVWQGMGYNRRAVYLKRLALTVMEKYGGRLPKTEKELESLPGIGRYTKGAVATFAYGISTVFIETNIRRALIDYFFPKKKRVSDDALYQLLRRILPQKNIREWYWALMDYGTFLAKIKENSNRRSKTYVKQTPFVGSRREARGRVLQFLGTQKTASATELSAVIRKTKAETSHILASLVKEGLLEKMGNRYRICLT